MKLIHAKIVIQPLNAIKKEWKAALSGKKKTVQKPDEIVFANLETVSKIFSKTRMEILQIIIKQKPKSIYELAKIVDRDFKNVYSDVKLLSDIGLVELKDANDPRSGLIPMAKFSGIDLDFAA